MLHCHLCLEGSTLPGLVSCRELWIKLYRISQTSLEKNFCPMSCYKRISSRTILAIQIKSLPPATQAI